MAVADFFVGLQPVAISHPGTVVLDQSEHESFTRVQHNVREVAEDVREDADDAFARLGTRMVDDPDAKAGYGTPWGAWGCDVQLDSGDAADVLVLSGLFTPATAPVKAALTVGLADAAIDFEARVPGNGSSALPRGNGILIFFDDNDLAGAPPLSFESAVVELEGRRYLAIVVHLAVAVGAVTTVANDIIDACDPTNIAYDAAIGQYLSASAPGTGADPVVGTTEGLQLEGGLGGLYEAFLNGDLAIVTDWDIVANTITLQADGTAFSAGETVTFAVVANGMISSLQNLVV